MFECSYSVTYTRAHISTFNVTHTIEYTQLHICCPYTSHCARTVAFQYNQYPRSRQHNRPGFMSSTGSERTPINKHNQTHYRWFNRVAWVIHLAAQRAVTCPDEGGACRCHSGVATTRLNVDHTQLGRPIVERVYTDTLTISSVLVIRFEYGENRDDLFYIYARVHGVAASCNNKVATVITP